jgi:hypothetical protein
VAVCRIARFLLGPTCFAANGFQIPPLRYRELPSFKR